MKFAFALVLLVVANCEACNRSDECKDGQCCVSSMQPIGKRNSFTALSRGSCQPLGHLSGGCLMVDAIYDDSKMFFQCPCQNGLRCNSTGMRVVPLGLTGTCILA